MFVEQWRDRHGKTRVYFRRGKGQRIPLPAEIGSEDFARAYADAMMARVATAGTTSRDTIAGLIECYLKSPDFVELRPTTRKGYLSRLDAIRITHGHRSVAGMTLQGIEGKILAPYVGKPGARLDTLKKLRILIKFAIRLGWLKTDPSFGIKRPKMKEIRSWSEDEIAAFERRWPVGTRERLAFALFLYVGQRVSDVHRMTWADISGNGIRVVQQKTGAALTIPLHVHLRAILAATKREHVTILNTAFGRPFTVKGLGQWLRDAITAAGLPLECQPHGLRKAAGRRLADAGCTAHEIMAILGHKTLAEAERYTREADQPRLSGTGIAKLEGRKRNKASLPQFPNRPKPSKKRRNSKEN